MDVTEKLKYPYDIIVRYTLPKGTLGIFVESPYDGCTSIANPLHSHTSLANMPHVLCFEVSASP
jgi:hypothetical protein